jgi:phosphoglucosamine mutase
MSRQYFGTDGIRGRVGSSAVNVEFVLKLGYAVGKVLVNGTRKKVLIGKDTRVSGYMLESALEAGLSAAGVDILLVGPMPTPAIAYLTQTLRASAGIVISASHNGFEDNGIKFFSESGHKLPESIELAIEEELAKPVVMVPSKSLGKAQRIDDAAGRYIERCKGTISPKTKLNGLKVVVDCANGATYHIAPNVFSELGAEVIEIGCKPDGFNINLDCGSTAPSLLQKTVLAENADLGIALDGDGDRVVLVDEKGQIIDGDDILYLLTKAYLTKKRKLGGVVGTVMSNYGLELALKDLNVPFMRTNVGDRYVSEALNEKSWLLGGENSGHIICRDKSGSGDGIVTALQVLSFLVKQQKPLSELCGGMEKLPQVLRSVRTSDAPLLLNNKSVQEKTKEITKALSGRGRVLVRPSGTEPLIRVMVEGQSLDEVNQYANELSDALEHSKTDVSS